MRGFVAALITFSFLLCAVMLNCVMLGRTLDGIIIAAESLPALPAETEGLPDGLRDEWRQAERFLSVTVSHSEIDKVDSLIASLDGYYAARDAGGYASTLAMLREALDGLRRSESFSMDGII